MTQELSSLMDGELGADEAQRAIAGCCASEDQKSTWYLYHAIGDAMRGHSPRRLGLPAEVFTSIRSEPTVLAPRRRVSQATVARIAMAAAASVATVGVVGWLGSQGGSPASPVPVVAKVASPVQPVASTVPAAAAAMPEDVQAYLAAHRQLPSPESYRIVNNRAAAPAR
jgi:sigma-E factor negative regulatory protein RseA